MIAAVRGSLHRWFVLLYFCVALSLAAWSRFQRARQRRRVLREMEVWT